MSLTATTSSPGARSRIAFSDCRPMRPKPFIPTRTAMCCPPEDRCRARSTVRGRGCGPTAAPGRVAETRDHEWVAAGQTDVFAEFGVDDLDPAAGSAEGGGGDLGPSRTEQSIPLSVRDRAADKDPGWVQAVDETNAGNREGAPTALHDLVARFVAGVFALGDVPCLDAIEALLGRAVSQKGALAGGHGLSSGLGHDPTPNERLEVADRAAAADALHRDRGVAKFTGGAVGAVEDPALGDDRPADAGRKRQVDEVGAIARRAASHLD